MSVDDVRAIIKVETALVNQQAIEHLEYLLKVASGDDEICHRLEEIQSGVNTLTRMLETREDVLVEADKVLTQMSAALTEMQTQRDAAMDELHTLIHQLINGNFWENDTTMEVYEAATEQHNEAFWSSLPYDMAAMLGGKWDFMDADLLYGVITAESEEEFADIHGLSTDAVKTFREQLLQLIRELADQRLGRGNKLSSS